MGLLKKLKKGVKNVFKGVKKVFKKALKFVGKIAASKWGKILMTAASIYMGGIAIYGAIQGVAQAGAGATFMQTFAAGAKGALAAMGSPVATGAKALGLGAETAGGAAALGGASGAGAFGAPAGWGELGTAAAGGAEAAGGAGAGLLATSAETAAAAAPGVASMGAPAGWAAAGQGAAQGAGASGGLLSKAAGAAWDFAKSPGGSKLIGNVIKGYGEGQAAEEEAKQRWKEQRYYDEQWRDPNQLAKLQGVVGGYTPYTPTAGTGYLSRAQGYQGNYQPGSPEAVAAYARGY